MHGEEFFFQAFVYLAAAVISVPIAKRLGLGLSFQTSLAIGMILSLSSTAIVLQTLNGKGLIKTDTGQS